LVSSYLPILIMILILLWMLRGQRAVAAKKAVEHRKKERTTEMVELAKRFVGKDCIISAFDSNHQFDGIIKEVTDGAVLIEKDGKLEAINLDFVIRIREYPRNKKGKKKAIV